MRKETIISVFVASPEDVRDDTQCLVDVIDELNLTWSKNLGIRLELVRWETHAIPGVGSDSQDVINRTIGNDYDIFKGILWARIGKPTSSAISGTVEEFQRAYERSKVDPKQCKIMFYFRDSPLPPSLVDPAQLAEVNKFKQQLKDLGVLFTSYQELDHFSSLLRERREHRDTSNTVRHVNCLQN